MEYTLAEYANLAEIIGAIAIIISFIFVGIQIRENTKATKSDMANSVTASLINWYQGVGNNSESSKLIYNYMIDPMKLTHEERYQCSLNLHGIILCLQNSFYLVKKGTMDAEIMQVLNAVLMTSTNQPGFAYFWQQRRALYLSAFQNYVDSIMASGIHMAEGQWPSPFDKDTEIESTKSNQ
jgi:hypothetical protein